MNLRLLNQNREKDPNSVLLWNLPAYFILLNFQPPLSTLRHQLIKTLYPCPLIRYRRMRKYRSRHFQVFHDRVVLKNFVIIRESSSDGFSFLMELLLSLQHLKGVLTQILSCEFGEISQNSVFCRTPYVTASGNIQEIHWIVLNR